MIRSRNKRIFVLGAHTFRYAPVLFRIRTTVYDWKLRVVVLELWNHVSACVCANTVEISKQCVQTLSAEENFGNQSTENPASHVVVASLDKPHHAFGYTRACSVELHTAIAEMQQKPKAVCFWQARVVTFEVQYHVSESTCLYCSSYTNVQIQHVAYMWLKTHVCKRRHTRRHTRKMYVRKHVVGKRLYDKLCSWKCMKELAVESKPIEPMLFGVDANSSCAVTDLSCSQLTPC